MMINITFGTTGFSAKFGTLFGKEDAPKILTIRLIFVTITVFSTVSAIIANKAFEQICNNEEWIMKNHPGIKSMVRERAEKIAKEEMEFLRNELDRTVQGCRSLHGELSRRNEEIKALKKTIKIVGNKGRW